jgi:hypothetical protein
LLEMVDQLHQDSAGPRDLGDRRDPQLMCRHVLGSLEGSVKRFDRHGRREVVEAFLLLAGRDNVTLNQILQDPHHAAFLITIEVLSSSSNGTVMRLLLSFLDDPHAPSAVLSVVANRGDLQFVRHLLRKIGREPSLTVSQNLKRVRSVGWLHRGEAFLQQLDDAAQHATVRLAMTARIPRLQVFATIECLLLHGKPGGRREAARALGEFRGADANALAVKALDDPDPQVQANAVVQLRRRGIPGVLPRLVGLVDSPHAVVREAAQENLDEFSFDRFVQAFDMLDDEVRRSTGVLVSKIDPQTVPRLREEMAAQARGRRLRALAIARTIDAVRQLEGAIIRLLKDKDHLIRAEAAASLARCSSTRSQQALEAALADSSTAVREAARKSLDTRKRFTQWLESLAEPRE